MKKYIIFLFCIYLNINTFSQSFSISGYIKDSASSEAIVGAMIFEPTTNTAVLSNEYGYFSIQVAKGSYAIECSSLGYLTQTKNVQVNRNTHIDFKLPSQSFEIGNVVVYAEQRSSEVLAKRLSSKQIELTPSAFGIPDVIKVVQTQPGIKTIGDATSGMYVRGGNRDQNMIRIDEANIYNASHMYGFVSTFNPDMVNDVSFYNSYFSPEFGGRLSSVLDAQMKEGNLNKYSGSALVSILTANAFVEGPIKKDVSSFFIGGRHSTLDIIEKYGELGFDVPSFYDVNAKINYKINNKNRVFLSSYASSDYKKYEQFGNRGLNVSGTVRWISELQPKLFLNSSFVASKYANNTEFADSTNQTWVVGVNEFTAKSILNWYVSNTQKVMIGIQASTYYLTPGDAGDTAKSISNMQLFEPSIFANHTITINDWKLVYGIRLAQYHNFGETTWYTLNEDGLAVSVNHEKNGIWNSYTSIEPRVHIARKIKNSEISASYTRTSQSMQILSNSKLAYSTLETWFCSSPNIKPAKADNVSVAYSLKKKSLGFLTEIYYRHINNQIDYIDGAYLYANPYVESQVKAGEANAYGFEMSLRYEGKRNQISASYSYARVKYNIPDIMDHVYPAPYDIPHDIKIQMSQRLKERWTLNALWIFASGRPGTFPYGYYYDNRLDPNTKVLLYNQRNSDTYPAYHRLDISLCYNGKPHKHIEQSFSLGLYNVYNRKNVLYYSFDLTSNYINVYYFGGLIPNITYKIAFK